MKKVIGVSAVLVVIVLAIVFYAKKDQTAVGVQEKSSAAAQKGSAVGQALPDKPAVKSPCEANTKLKDIVAGYGKTWAYSSTDSLKMDAQGTALSDIDKLKKDVFKTQLCVSLAEKKNRCGEFMGKTKKPDEVALKEECSVAYGKTGFMAYAAGDATKREFCSLHYKYLVAEDSGFVSEDEFCSKAGQGLEKLKEVCSKFPAKAKEQCLVYFDETKCKDCKADWELYRAFKNPGSVKSLSPELQAEINAFKTGSKEGCGEDLLVSEYCTMAQKVGDHYAWLVSQKKK